jgi:hypothetical protein
VGGDFYSYGVILSAAVLQAKRRISRPDGSAAAVLSTPVTADKSARPKFVNHEDFLIHHTRKFP